MGYTGWSLEKIADKFRDGINTHSETLGVFGDIQFPLFSVPLKTNLNIMNGNGYITIGRNTTATYIDRYGMLKYVNEYDPRFEKQGLLVEPTSTNFQLFSNIDSNWESYGTLTTNNTIGPDGTINMNKIESDGTVTIGNDFGVGYQTNLNASSVGFIASRSYFVKSGNVNTVSIIEPGLKITYNLSTNNITVEKGVVESSHIIELYNGIKRIEVSWKIAADTSYKSQIVSTNNNLGDYFYVWGSQLEETTFCTSYIPTTTTQVLREKEDITFEGYNNFPDTKEVSISLDFDINGFKTDEGMQLLTAETLNNDSFYIMLGQDTTLNGTDTVLGVVREGENNVEFYGTPYDTVNFIDGKTHKLSTVLSNNLEMNKIVLDNVEYPHISLYGAQYDVTDNFVPRKEPVYKIRINSANSWCGHISNIRIYDFALSETALNFS